MATIQLIAVGSGAAIGAWVRWGLNTALNANILPLGTLIANLIGGFLIGITMANFMYTSDESALSLFVITGFLGGLTTFSAFSAEAFNMLHKQEYTWALMHVSSHVLESLLMTALGFTLMHYFKS